MTIRQARVQLSSPNVERVAHLPAAADADDRLGELDPALSLQRNCLDEVPSGRGHDDRS